MDEIILPAPKLSSKISLEETLQKRRSVRQYSDKELSAGQISQLLWAAQGKTNARGFRTAPSAGASFPLEVYVAKKDGLFHYIPGEHKLVKTKDGDMRVGLQRQPFIEKAPVVVIIAAVYERVTRRYGERGKRYVDIEVGHAAQNILLQAVGLGLGSVPVGAFRDENVKEKLGLPDEQIPLYLIPVGYEK